jgi:hypothetical protein
VVLRRVLPVALADSVQDRAILYALLAPSVVMLLRQNYRPAVRARWGGSQKPKLDRHHVNSAPLVTTVM